ncbi:MAG: hypothetical protein IPK19_20705, partial [Chloroflexi bacterium]|nr:hypothetical protein [Chloroflexota bacterium]
TMERFTDQRGPGFFRFVNALVDIGAAGGQTQFTQAAFTAVSLQGRTNPTPHPSYLVAVGRADHAGAGGALSSPRRFPDQPGRRFYHTGGCARTVFVLLHEAVSTLARHQLVDVTEGVVIQTGLLLEGDATGQRREYLRLAAGGGVWHDHWRRPGCQPASRLQPGWGGTTISDFSLLAANFTTSRRRRVYHRATRVARLTSRTRSARRAKRPFRTGDGRFASWPIHRPPG